jgi:acyl dehydratase
MTDAQFPDSGVLPRWPRLDAFHEGDAVRTPGRTITEADLVMFSAITGGMHSPLHLDREWVLKNTSFPDRVAPGTMTYSYAISALSATLAYQGAVVAYLGTEHLRAHNPVIPGDTIHTLAEVVSSKPTSKGDRGVVEFGITVLNHRDEKVMTFTYVLMVRA